MASSQSTGTAAEVLLDTTMKISIANFARLARSEDFYRSTRAETKMTKQEVVDLGEWVAWEFQSEDEEAPSSSENSEEVVPDPPAVAAAGKGEGATEGAKGSKGEGKGDDAPAKEGGQGRPQQMYRKIRLRTAVSSPLGTSHNDGVQGQTLRKDENEVLYTETDCVAGLPMFKGDMAVKTTYRVTRSEDDPDNSVHVKVTVVVRDVKLSKGMGFVSKLVQKSIRDSGKKQASKTLDKMVASQSTPGL